MSLATSMPTSLENPPAAKRTRSPRATSRQGSAAASKPKKVSFYLSPEAIRRLGIAATMGDTDKSKILEMVISESPSLRRYVVSDRAKVADQAMVEVSSD